MTDIPMAIRPTRTPGTGWSLLLALFFLTMASKGCGVGFDPYTAPIAFDTAHVVVEDGAQRAELLVEIAETENQQIRGLSGRDSLDPDSGMLFLFDGERSGQDGFWMYRTRIPLDIAFLDGDGVILGILTMAPCRELRSEDCPTYAPDVPYHSALEANGGWFAAMGLGEGSRVVWER